MTDRREFLRMLTTAGAATLMPANGMFAQEKVNKVEVRGGAIDVHHHHAPPGPSRKSCSEPITRPNLSSPPSTSFPA
jgi:hypothetical protein